MQVDEEWGFEVMKHWTRKTGLTHNFYTDSMGRYKNNSDKPLLYVEVGKEIIPIELDEEPVLLESCAEDMTDILDFIRFHHHAFVKHWNGEWDDGDMGNYIKAVGRRKMTIPEALKFMKEKG